LAESLSLDTEQTNKLKTALIGYTKDSKNATLTSERFKEILNSTLDINIMTTEEIEKLNTELAQYNLKIDENTRKIVAN
jgi:hypothetical protein